ncbi:MAG: hypothetical protein COS84_01820 [Armatimonadetes bacterium CG07_land_8_20_14_0_80_40_9]|nr:MAG: hypothetical protein COS84_01820 [Armatimonadetes bacterium CG07_land_8_20_14_0_80_40_9]
MTFVQRNVIKDKEMSKEKIEVKTYAGYKADEGPSAFVWQGKKYKASKIESSWQEEDLISRKRKDFFKVKDEGGNLFILSHSKVSDEWLLEEKQ